MMQALSAGTRGWVLLMLCADNLDVTTSIQITENSLLFSLLFQKTSFVQGYVQSACFFLHSIRGKSSLATPSNTFQVINLKFEHDKDSKNNNNILHSRRNTGI